MSTPQIKMIIESHLDRLSTAENPEDFMGDAAAICGLTQEANLALSRVHVPLDSASVKGLEDLYYLVADVMLQRADKLSVGEERMEQVTQMVENIKGRAKVFGQADSAMLSW